MCVLSTSHRKAGVRRGRLERVFSQITIQRSSKESVNKYGISCVWIQIAQDALLLDTLTF